MSRVTQASLEAHESRPDTALRADGTQVGDYTKTGPPRPPRVTYNNISPPHLYGSNTSGVKGVLASSAAVWWPMAMSMRAAWMAAYGK